MHQSETPVSIRKIQKNRNIPPGDCHGLRPRNDSGGRWLVLLFGLGICKGNAALRGFVGRVD